MSGAMCAMAGGGNIATPAVVTLGDGGYSDTAGGGPCDCWYQLNADGHAYQVYDDLTSAEIEQWCDPPGSAAQFEARVTVTSGALSAVNGSDAASVWLALSSSRKWGVRDSIADTSPVVCSFTVEIRDAATQTVQASASITLIAFREN